MKTLNESGRLHFYEFDGRHEHPSPEFMRTNIIPWLNPDLDLEKVKTKSCRDTLKRNIFEQPLEKETDRKTKSKEASLE